MWSQPKKRTSIFSEVYDKRIHLIWLWLISDLRFKSVLSYPFGIVISSTSSTVSPKPGLKVCWPPRSLRNSSKVCVFCIQISNKINGSVNKHKKDAVLKLTGTEIAENDCMAINPCSGGASSESAEDFCQPHSQGSLLPVPGNEVGFLFQDKFEFFCAKVSPVKRLYSNITDCHITKQGFPGVQLRTTLHCVFKCGSRLNTD